MPNYVTNHVVFQSSADARRARKYMETEKCAFDFNRLVPMPESLMVKEGAVSDVALWWFTSERGTCLEVEPPSKHTVRRVVDYVERGQYTSDSLYELGRVYHDNIAKYGHRSWYWWCCDNWGTKWNACNVTWSDFEVYFDTAWADVRNLVELLANRLDMCVYYEYADEDFGSNLGEGFVTPAGAKLCLWPSDSFEAFATASRLQDEDQSYARWDSISKTRAWDDDSRFAELPIVDTSSRILADGFPAYR